ncbi:hypothetical protein JF66_10455 [Cryobacterium sp. MLB-32]|uniref:PadR family transcriptional regulator n=1 Tax=Cryobacterium sp. MLB-32 TaxID=1529318 RepID=UPI0004E6859D|nr:PadR family transcriptional regulator [Cryobacterium sp. MLB-32]KFF59561.1 hypothetical protein JF66_10455 [Cryobacterium sp. MLB-32]
MTRKGAAESAPQDAQALRGVLPMLLLSQVARQESYGYELVVRLQRLGLTDLATGTVYPALTRLESEGALSSRLVASAAGPARKYYSLTEHGTRVLAASATRWKTLGAIVDSALAPLPPATQPQTQEDQ